MDEQVRDQMSGEEAENPEQEAVIEEAHAGPEAGAGEGAAAAQQEAGEEKEDAEAILEELDRLGDAFARAVQAAWKSEQRKELEEDLRRGLAALIDNVEEVMTRVNRSEQTQELKEQAGRVVERVRASKASAELKKGLTKGLQTAAEEMQKVADDMESRRAEEKPSASAETAQDIPVENAEESGEESVS